MANNLRERNMSKLIEIIDEIWKPIINYENLYEISNYGRIKGLKNAYHKIDRFIKPSLSKTTNYYRVNLYKNSKVKCIYLHIFLAENFIGAKPSNKHEVRHLDGNRLNNKLENLKWGTRSENVIDCINHGNHYFSNNIVSGIKHHSCILNKNEVLGVRNMINSGVKYKIICKKYNISRYTIDRIKNNKTYKDV